MRQLFGCKCFILISLVLRAGMKQLSRSIFSDFRAAKGKMLEIKRSTFESIVLNRSFSNCENVEDADMVAVLKICS